MALGYLIAKTIAFLWMAADMPRLSGRLAAVLTWVVSGTIALFFFWALASSLIWQNELRQKMGIEPAEAPHLFQILVIAIGTFAIAYALGRAIGLLFEVVRAWFYRVMPPRRANVLGVVAVVLILFVATRDGILDRVIAGLDESYESAQALFDQAPRGLPTHG